MVEQISCEATVTDKEVASIKVIVTLKEGVEKPVSSMVIERATQTWLADHLPTWTTYCIENSMKTL